jgi:hypothetical protein
MKPIPLIVTPPGSAGKQVYLWSPDKPSNSNLELFWESKEIKVEQGNETTLPNYPSACLVTDDSIYIGTRLGTIDIINRNTNEVKSIDRFDVSQELRQWDLYGSKENYEKSLEERAHFEKWLEKRGGSDPKLDGIVEKMKKNDRERMPNYFGLHLAYVGIRKIRGFAFHEGAVYDGSSAGIYDTDTDKLIRPVWASSLSILNGRLCHVPVKDNIPRLLGRNDMPGYDPEVDLGDLVDTMKGFVHINRLTPFDGSGCSQGTYCFGKKSVFIHHGNWPGEVITERDIKTGEIKGQISIPTSDKFVAYKGNVFDIRELHDERYLMSSQEGDFRKKHIIALEAGDDVTGDDDLGILISRYYEEGGRSFSRIFSLENPKRSFFTLEGSVDFF